ncbi:PASTA domain-containing protein [Alloscardovia omnicolens]|uniref:Stk1 family PASTA domain-containing Ser/Thr kinase n=1 Tax=Alloscardovia omnicolens TaxID=419015 RepID=UPI003A7A819E
MTTASARYINQLIDNRYLISRKIAEGGMASVYEATDQRLNKRVAIKIMHTSLALSEQGEQYAQRFHREALSAAALDNPHIVHVFDAGRVDGVGYIVMEYVEGVNLRKMLRTKHTFSVHETLSILHQILDGLSAAHEQNIIHRDIKPENIMINSRGDVQIADFGLAKHTSNATLAPTGMILGTTTYIAPETAENNTSLPASDIYAVGLVAWEMLVGHAPFESDNPVTVVYKHVHEDVPDLRIISSRLPSSLCAYIASLVQRDPALRPDNASTAARQLQKLLQSLSASDLNIRLTYSGDHQTSPRTPQKPERALAKQSEMPSLHITLPKSSRPSAFATLIRWVKTYKITTAVLGFITLILIIAGSVSWWDNWGPGSYYSLPAATDSTCTAQSSCTLQGADAAQYQKLLKNEGISFTVSKKHSDTIASGKIISSQPSTVGSHISKKDGTVSLTVSTGIEKITIPSDIDNPQSHNGKDPLKTLKKAGFTNIKHANNTDEYSLSVPEGAIISISPKPGTRINHNTQITVILSRGLKTVVVPNVVGMSRGDALAALAQLKLTATVKEEYSSTAPAGEVLSQSEKSGAELRWNDSITLTVSKGAQTVTVPDVRGMTLARAQTTLEDLGFTVKVSRKGGDTVAKQSLSPGEITSVIDNNGEATTITLTSTKK